MDKKKLLLIGAGVMVLVVGIIVALSFIGKGSDEKSSAGETVKLSSDFTLTDAEKATIKGGTEKFIQTLGNYGWYPELIKNPQVASGDKNFDKVFKQEHTTAEDAQASIRALTNSTSFDAVVNKNAYSVPFSVETKVLGDIKIADSPTVEGDRTFIPVNVPIESTLSYISSSIGYADESGVWHDSESFVQQFTFKGELNLQFSKGGSKWVVTGFTNTVGVFAIDPLSFSNGDAISEYLATTSNKIPVNR